MPALPPDDPRIARREASHRKVIRRRRFLVAVGAALTLVVVVGGIWLLYSGLFGGQDSSSASKAAAPHLTTPAEAPVAADAMFSERARRERAAVAQTLARMPYVAVAGRQNREIALTFDDGPGPSTAAVVKLLRREHVSATFFQTGGTLHYFTDGEADATRGQSFVVANHTVTHPHMGKLKPAEQAREIDDNNRILTDAGAPAPQLFRTPFGHFDQTTLKLLRERGMLMVFWTIDSKDWARPGTKKIVSNVVGKAKPGAIVLMHDAGGERSQTIAALPSIIRKLRKRGYKFVTVPKLLLDNPPPDKQPSIVPGVG